MPSEYFAEITDTYAGEANYSWVRRFRITARSGLGALRKLSAHQGYQGCLVKTGDFGGGETQHDLRNAAIRIFINPWDEDTHGKYARVETLP